MPKLLSICRGCPGSGKSYLARSLDGLVLSTDDFFMKNGKYIFEPSLIAQAHAWNQKRARKAMQDGFEHIIIDNTNTKLWEMKPYVEMAERFGYQVEFIESKTPWAKDSKECAIRNTHGVPEKVIERMIGGYDSDASIASCLAAKAPWEK